MTSTHRLAATIVIWIAFAAASFALAGASLFLSSVTIPLSLINALAAVAATGLIARARTQPDA